MQIPEGTIIDNRFRIVRRLGEGGMGAVFEAQQMDLERTVAIKFLTEPGMTGDEAFARFQQEAQVLSQIRHKNIVGVYAFGKWHELAYMVMECLDGTSINDMLRKQGALDRMFVLDVGLQVCSGLESAHIAGVVHRDLKPSNLIVTADGVVKIIDFGLAKVLVSSAAGRQQLTEAGVAVGSVLYMSPEQCIGAAVDPRADIYSLGCVLHHCLAGTPPFVGDHSVVVMMQHTNEMPPRLQEAGALGSVVWNALAKNANDRYQTAAEMRHDLEVAAKDGTVDEKSVTPLAVAIAPKRRRANSAAIAVVAVLALAVGCLVYATVPRQSAAPPVEQEFTLNKFARLENEALILADQNKIEESGDALRQLLPNLPRGTLRGQWVPNAYRAVNTLLTGDYKIRSQYAAADCARAFQIAQQLPCRDYAELSALVDIAESMRFLGHANEAYPIFDRAGEFLSRDAAMGPPELDLSSRCIAVGNSYSERHNQAKVEAMYRLADQYAERAENPQSIIMVIGYGMRWNINRNENVKRLDALTHLAPHLRLWRENLRMTNYCLDRDLPNAEKSCDRALKMIRTHGLECQPANIIETYAQASDLAYGRREREKALQLIKEAEDVYRDHQDELMQDQNMLKYLEIRRKRIEESKSI
jgi:serine/threonine protein kinase